MPTFKPELSLCDVLATYGNNDRCRAYLEALRWPDKVTCPNCLSDKISRIKDRHQYDCDSCRYQFSVTAGTIFHDSHLPLVKWFATVYLMCESRKGVSANQIRRMMGISYKTAWYLCHRIRAAMKEVNPAPLTGTVEVDETYVGGKFRGGYSGRAKNNKEIESRNRFMGVFDVRPPAFDRCRMTGPRTTGSFTSTRSPDNARNRRTGQTVLHFSESKRQGVDLVLLRELRCGDIP